MSNERQRIIAEYHLAVGAYREAVSRLDGLTGSEFEVARRKAEEAREICEQKRAALNNLDGDR